MRTRFITSGTDPGSFPPTRLPEIAFLGRSNVGKSSLLNKVAGARVARTSKTPGRTQTVNFFEVATDKKSGAKGTFILADLPGYGYAKASKSARLEWARMIERYVDGREQLVAVLMLVDARRTIEPEDVRIYRTLCDAAGGRRQVCVVATKCDKLSKAKIKPALKTIAVALDLPPDAVIGTSAETGAGIEELRRRLIAFARTGSTAETGQETDQEDPSAQEDLSHG